MKLYLAFFVLLTPLMSQPQPPLPPEVAAEIAAGAATAAPESPDTQNGNGAPIGPDGRMPGLPPGVPLPAPQTRPSNRVQTGTLPSPGSTLPGSVSQAAIPKAPMCDVQLSAGRTDLGAKGGEFAVAASMAPAFCALPSISAPWLRIVDRAKLLFEAEPNTSTTPRETMIAIGNASLYIRQEHPLQPGIAAAPGKLIFGIDKEGKTDTRKITAWTEGAASKLRARAGDPWLSIKPSKAKNNRQSYEVTISREAALGPGRHDSFIELITEGSSTSLRIPIVAEVAGTF